MPWEQLPIVPGQAVPNFVAVGSNKHIWGVNTISYKIYKWDVSKQVWNVMTGASDFISVGAGGSTWCINDQGGVDQWSDVEENWTPRYPNVMNQLSVGSDEMVWAIEEYGTTVMYNAFAQWAPIDADVLLNWVCVSEADSNFPPVWGINTSGQLLQYDWKEQDWSAISGTPVGVIFSQIAMIDGDRVFCLGTNNKLYYRYYGAWSEMPGTFNNISAAADGTLWGVNTLGQICYFRRCPPLPEQPLTLVLDGDSLANYKTLAANIANGYEMIGLMAVRPIEPTAHEACYPKILPGTVFLFPGIKVPSGTTPAAYQGTVHLNCKSQPPIIEYTGQINPPLTLHQQMCDLMGNKSTTDFIGFSIKNSWNTKDGVVFDSETCNLLWFGTPKIPECDCNSINWRAQIMTALSNSLG